MRHILPQCAESAHYQRKEGIPAVIFGKYINRYYLKNAPVLLLGLASLLMVDYIQLLVPSLYRLVGVVIALGYDAEVVTIEVIFYSHFIIKA